MRTRSAIQAAEADMLVTTTSSVEGRRITKYCGVV
jgi:hypothetical protein